MARASAALGARACASCMICAMTASEFRAPYYVSFVLQLLGFTLFLSTKGRALPLEVQACCRAGAAAVHSRRQAGLGKYFQMAPGKKKTE